MKFARAALALTVVLLSCASDTGADRSDPQEKAVSQSVATPALSFDLEPTGSTPEGWNAEGTNQKGPVASWIVKADTTAPSRPNVLALTNTKEARGNTYNICWTNRKTFKNGVVQVKVKSGAGREDQGGGPIWRVQDKDNYYIARWNPLEDNFRVYSVKNSRRRQLESGTFNSDPSKWHTIRIEHAGDEIRCYFDDKPLKTVRDCTFPDEGGVGVWTKADAVTMFDDLQVRGAAE